MMDFKDIVVVIGAIILFIIALILCVLPFVLAGFIASSYLGLIGLNYWAFTIVMGCMINAILGALSRVCSK